MSTPNTALDLDRILAIKQAAQSRLLAIPGVHAVGIGGKVVGGERTAEPSIMVFLAEKKRLSDLAPHEVVPPDIDGVKTDVVELGVPYTLAGRPEAPDDGSYWSFFGTSIDVRGGMQIKAANGAEVGTLGCMAHPRGQPSKRLAITCHHVVAALRGLVTDLRVEVSADQRTFTMAGDNTPGSLVVALFTVRRDGNNPNDPDEVLDAFWTTTSADTLATIAQNVATAINGMAHPGVRATAQLGNVTILPQAGFTVTSATCEAFDPHRADPEAQLRASIAGNVITLDGQVSGDYGIYTSLNEGGASPSRGVLTTVAKGASLDSVAASIAASITTSITQGGVPEIRAAALGRRVTITGVPTEVQEIECDIRSDLRVGQPNDSFCSRCCYCCDDRIGRIVDARLDLDVALVEIDSDLGSKPEIVDIGTVTGVRTTIDPDIADQIIAHTYPVKKRGRNTRLTKGTIFSLHMAGNVVTVLPRKNGTKSRVFHHHYADAVMIRPDDSEEFHIDGRDIRVFAREGDSGAALVNDAREVMGIVFGATTAPNGDLWAVATPIEAITSAFNITIATPNAPPPAPQPFAIAPEPLAGGGGAAPVANPRERLREMEREITSTAAGRKYAELVRRHFAEARTLVDTNRRVATVWHRSGGPRIVQGLLQLLQRPEQALPAEIDGKPLPDCLLEIQRVFARYGSRALAADLDEVGPSLVRLAGLTYPEALSALRTMVPE